MWRENFNKFVEAVVAGEVGGLVGVFAGADEGERSDAVVQRRPVLGGFGAMHDFADRRGACEVLCQSWLAGAAEQMMQRRTAHVAIDQQHAARLVTSEGDGEVGGDKALALLGKAAADEDGLEGVEVAKLVHARAQAAELFDGAAAVVERGQLNDGGRPRRYGDGGKVEVVGAALRSRTLGRGNVFGA